MTEHSPVPWTFDIEEDSQEFIKTSFYIRACDGKYLIAVGCLQAESTIPNARFIVTACNCHADLLEALNEIAKGEGAYSRDPLEHASNAIVNMRQIAREAIRKAEDQS